MFKHYYPAVVLKRKVLIQFSDIKTGKVVTNSHKFLQNLVDSRLANLSTSEQAEVDALKWRTIFNIASTHNKKEICSEEKYYLIGRLLNRVPSEVIQFGDNCVSIDGNPYTICRTETAQFYEGDTEFKIPKYRFYHLIWDFILGYY